MTSLWEFFDASLKEMMNDDRFISPELLKLNDWIWVRIDSIHFVSKRVSIKMIIRPLIRQIKSAIHTSLISLWP